MTNTGSDAGYLPGLEYDCEPHLRATYDSEKMFCKFIGNCRKSITSTEGEAQGEITLSVNTQQ
ncbi:uncharacterized protein RCO7_15021 [Rhynchosporium graminicola]|uniref:Uncharacterized protein n=1 Tax=Rhynchosporium graminicola TaxID=2792576 RepID=A0A1E1LFU4_9HELO|nr:uncharacterized protein RCO7_15021 [Rhynchosporium commune]